MRTKSLLLIINSLMIPLTYIHMTDNFPGLVQEPLIQDNWVKLDYE
jgi:hypothetical protein